MLPVIAGYYARDMVRQIRLNRLSMVCMDGCVHVLGKVGRL